MTQFILVGVIKDYTNHPFYPFKDWVESGYMHSCMPPGQIVLLLDWDGNTYSCKEMSEEQNCVWYIHKDCVDVIGKL